MESNIKLTLEHAPILNSWYSSLSQYVAFLALTDIKFITLNNSDNHPIWKSTPDLIFFAL